MTTGEQIIIPEFKMCYEYLIRNNDEEQIKRISKFPALPIIVDPPKSSPIFKTPKAALKPKKKAPVEIQSNSSVPLSRNWTLSSTYLAGVYNYNFSTSNNQNLSYSALAHTLELKSQWFRSNRDGIFFKLAGSSYEFSDLSSGITPNSLPGKNLNATFAYMIHIVGGESHEEGLFLNLGFKYFKQTMGKTTPIQITDTTALSFGLGLSGQKNTSTKNQYGFIFNIYSAFKHSESPVTSGKFDQSIDADFQVYYNFHLREHLYLNIGHRFQYRLTSFSGTGSRGSVDAEAREQQNSVMLGLKYEF